MAQCGYECYTVGGPFIAEDPQCPIHGSGGIGDEMEQLKTVVRELCKMLEGYADPEHIQADELIARARNLASW